jgi:hypothetical protein
MASAVGRPVEVRAYAERIEIRQDGQVCGATIRVRFRVNQDETPRWVCDGRRA